MGEAARGGRALFWLGAVPAGWQQAKRSSHSLLHCEQTSARVRPAAGRGHLLGCQPRRAFRRTLSRAASHAWVLQGTADAVRQYLWLFEEAMRDGVEDFLILSGEQEEGLWGRSL